MPWGLSQNGQTSYFLFTHRAPHVPPAQPHPTNNGQQPPLKTNGNNHCKTEINLETSSASSSSSTDSSSGSNNRWKTACFTPSLLPLQNHGTKFWISPKIIFLMSWLMMDWLMHSDIKLSYPCRTNWYKEQQQPPNYAPGKNGNEESVSCWPWHHELQTFSLIKLNLYFTE